MKTLSLITGCFLFAGLFSCSTDLSNKNPKKAEKPNVVFIFTDDQTYTSIHSLGNAEISTPNLDKLVETGTSFTHVYNMGGWNGAVCMASRAMMNSGRFIWRARAFSKKWQQRDSAALEKSWSRMMEAAGYDTYMTGKWHVSAPAAEIFMEASHVRPGMPKDNWGNRSKQGGLPIGYNRPLDEKDTSWSPTDPKFGGFWEGGKHWSEVGKDDALSFIQKAKDKDNPFFMYLAFNAPHDPRQSPQEFIDKYPLDKISLPESWLPEYPYRNEIGNSVGLRDEALAPFPRTPFAIKTHIQEYYAIISHLDQQIGQIVNALEQSGKMDNTYIIFSSDHGLAIGRHGLLGKQSLFDHSIRVPLMIVGPGIPKGAKVDADIYLQDVMATSLDLAGIEKPEYVEFNSFLDLAKGETSKSHYSEIYGAYIDFQRMIRKDGYKLIVYPKIDKILLFDMNKDPEEMTDLAALPENKEKVMVLFKDLIKLQKNMDDKLDLQSLLDNWMTD